MGNPASRFALAILALGAVAAAHGQAVPGQCGYERWPVKILADEDEKRVDLKPIDTTVARLAAIPIHEVPYPMARRIEPEELHVYRVRARLVEVRREQDHDLHLLIADPDAPSVHMIAEIPAPECVQSHRDEYKKARAAILVAPRTALVELWGVGFFDFLHNQRGGARNGIELHPVLNVRVVSEGQARK